MISGISKAMQMKLCIVIVLLQTFHNTKKFRNLTYNVLMTSLLKTIENSDPRETAQIIYNSKGNDGESFQKM